MRDRRSFLLGLAAGAAATTLPLLNVAPTLPHGYGWTPSPRATAMFENRDRWKASDVDGDIVGAGKNKVVRLWKLWELASRVEFSPHLQTIGDCVSQAMALGLETQSGVRVASGEDEEWHGKASTELLYAASRIEVGRGQYGFRDGSNGAWMAEAAEKFGVLPRANYGQGIDVTNYNPDLARQMANSGRFRRSEGVPSWLEPQMKNNTLLKAVRINKGWKQACDFVASGMPILLCSSVGYITTTDGDGFLLRSKKDWDHSMLLWGIDTISKRQAGNIANSWGREWCKTPNTHRHGCPAGCFWSDAGNIELMLASNDCYALVEFHGPKKLKLST